MTVITKPVSEKKAEKQEQPLVTAEVLPNRDVEEGIITGEKYIGAAPEPLPNYLAPWNPPRAKRRSAIPTLCLLLLALFVMSVGIIAGLYLYRQFARPPGMRYSFRGSCQIPFDDRIMASGYSGSDLQFVDDRIEGMSLIQNLQNELRKTMNDDGSVEKVKKNYLNEDVEISGDDYEKITVPDLFGTDKNRFIHDFNFNLTGIVDLTRHHCFIMPLNRSQVLPPDDLMDLVQKMWAGYYELNTDVIRETMRVVLPPVENSKSLGEYIQRECKGFPIYRLEKFVSGVTKRSVQEEPAHFVQFAGKTNVFSIVNMAELEEYEKAQ